MAMEPEELMRRIDGLLDDCEMFTKERREKRQKALDYFNGEMARYVPNDAGRSSMTSKDVRSVIKKVVPAMKRVILGSDEIVEYQPGGPEDEQRAKDATTYINRVVVKESRVDEAISDMILSALLLDEGPVTWYQEEKARISVTHLSGQSADDMAAVEAEAGAEILDIQPQEVDIGGVVETLYRARVKRAVTESRTIVKSIPMEDLLVHPDATTEDDAPLIGHIMRLRRTDLVAQGYPRELVDDLPLRERSIEDEDEHESRNPDDFDGDMSGNGIDAEMEEIEVCRLFVRIDEDGDGIAELREIHYVRDAGEANGILFDDYADEVCIAVGVVERVLHSFRGVSLFDDVEELQTLKTVLIRQILDNLYASNNPQAAVQEGAIRNPEAVTNPQYGNPVRVKQGVPIEAALQWRNVPFFAEKTIPMLSLVDQTIVDRTGITSAASALDPNALQNVREQGVEMISDAAAAQAWCMAREMAKGALARMFRGVLRLVVQHQDKPRQVRLGNQWMQFDPASWNADMDCIVNVGLGTGTRESDLRALMSIKSEQQIIIKEYGGDNPFVTPVQYARTLHKIVEAVGLASPDMYFTMPQEGQPFRPPQGPSPEEVKAQAQMQIEQVKAAAARDKEMAQAEADMMAKQGEAQLRAQEAAFKADLDKAKSDEKLAFDRQKHADEMRLKWAEFNVRNAGEQGEVDPETGERQPSQIEMLAGQIAAMSEQIAGMAQVAAMPRVRTMVGPNGKVYQARDEIDTGGQQMVN